MKREDEKKLLSVIIPAYKQEKTIVKDLRRIRSVLDKIRFDYEMIIVVDGIIDKTYSNAKKLNYEKLKVFGYKNNKGKGYAIRYGMARAKGDLVAFIDSGMDIDPNGISMLLEHMEWYKADIIVGSKRHPASQIEYPFIRRVYSLGYQSLFRFLFGLNLKDTQAGLKIFKHKVLKKVLPRLLVKRFASDVEMLVVAYRLGYQRIFEAPIKFDPKFFAMSTTMGNLKSLTKMAINMLVDTLAVFYRLKILHYYDDGNKRRWKYDPDLDFRVNI